MYLVSLSPCGNIQTTYSQGNLAGCVSKPLGQEVGEVLVRETLKADPAALARLMADHTQVGRLGVCLVQVTALSGCCLSAGFLYLQRLQRDERCSPGAVLAVRTAVEVPPIQAFLPLLQSLQHDSWK